MERVVTTVPSVCERCDNDKEHWWNDALSDTYQFVSYSYIESQSSYSVKQLMKDCWRMNGRVKWNPDSYSDSLRLTTCSYQLSVRPSIRACMLLGTFGWGFSAGNIYNAKHKDTYAFTNILDCFGKSKFRNSEDNR